MKIGDLIQTPKAVAGRGDGGGPPAGKGEAPAATLEKGALLQGRVVSSGADGRLVLDLAGQRITARSAVPLPAGREFWFEVSQGGKEPRLVLADKQGGIQLFLQQAAGGLKDLGRLDGLLQLLGKLVLPGGQGVAPGLAAALGGGDPTALLSRLLLGGEPAPEKVVQLLTRLDGPKPQLPAQLQALVAAVRSQIQASLAGATLSLQEAAAGRETLAALARVGGVLEAMVAMNEQPPPSNQAPFWLLPCFFALDAGAGSWLLSREGGQEGGEESSSLTFFLEMSHLGELQLQVRVQGERLEGDFFLADPEAARFLGARLGELQQRLAELGYRAILRCRTGAEPLLPALKEALEKAAGATARRLIDIKA